ncbi:11634_t:CDS:10, partial [Funneliformis mosseae]
VTSQIQIEAYKKFSLVSLLLLGKIAPLPKYTASVVYRSAKNQCQAYQDYASAFESLNVKRLRNEFTKWTDIFRKDKNLGLAKQTLSAIYRRNIQQLTQTYLTLSLADIADAVGLEGRDAPKIAENYVLRMIESREIFATISHSHQNGMVSFHDNPDRYDTSLTITQLEEQINKSTTVSERVIKTDRLVGCSKEYLTKSQHMLTTGGAIPGGLGPGDDPDFLGGSGGFEHFIDDVEGKIIYQDETNLLFSFHKIPFQITLGNASGNQDRVKCVDFHPTEPWLLASLYNGNVYIWNYETQALVKTFEVTDVPVRAAKFIARKNWLITGSDDMQIRVFNYNTHEKITTFEAHPDYIRCIAIHPTQPFVLTGSDDMTVKLWDWEKGWKNIQIFEGHTHYVMNINFNPKDSNTFASACLDRTIKVWSIGSTLANFTLEGHEKGVNWVEYYHGGEKPYLVSAADDKLVKIWDYQNKT